MLRILGRHDEMALILRQVHSSLARKFGPDDIRVANASYNLVLVDVDRGRFTEGVAPLTRTLASLDKLKRKYDDDLLLRGEWCLIGALRLQRGTDGCPQSKNRQLTSLVQSLHVCTVQPFAWTILCWNVSPGSIHYLRSPRRPREMPQRVRPGRRGDSMLREALKGRLHQ